jgi:hypothetical protein
MDRSIPVENRAGLAAGALSHLSTALESHRSIKHAVDWLAAHDSPIGPVGMVTHDEYSHDILVAYPGGLWLVYDST